MLGTSKSISVFDPRSLGGCRLWLDGADSSTLFADLAGTTLASVSGQVQLWKDKSYGANHFSNKSANTSVYFPTRDSVGGVYIANTGIPAYSSTTYCCMRSISNFFTASYYSIYAVVKFPTYSTNDKALQTIFCCQRSADTNETRNPQWCVSGGFAVASTPIPLVSSSIRSSAGGDYNNFIGDEKPTANTICVMAFTSGVLSNAVFRSGKQVASGQCTSYVPWTTCGSPPSFAGWFQANGTTTDSRWSTANYYEFLIFDSEHNPAQRKQIEGYLSWKWGVQSTLSSVHPFYSRRPLARQFNPNDIAGCGLWLDGADASTMFQDTAGTTPVTANGQLVSRWKDKSQNGFAFTTGAGGTAPTYNTNALNSVSGVTFGSTESSTTFSTNFKWLDSTINCYSSFTLGGSNTTVFAVLNVNALSQHNRVFYTSIDLDMGILYPWTGAGFIWDQPYNSAANRLLNSYSTTGGQILSLVRSGANMTAYANGTSFASLSTASGTIGNASSTVSIGGGLFGGTYYTFNSNICEMVIYNRDLTTVERQQTEGYLAWKWGLLASLPSTHSLKSFPPAMTSMFLPTNIVGCELWLDANDASTVTGTSPVTAWSDKSGNGRNLGVGSGTTTYVSYAIGSAVKLNASYMFVTSAVNLTNVTAFIVAASPTIVNNQTVFGGRPNTSAQYSSTDGFGFYIDTGGDRVYGGGPITNTFSVSSPFLTTFTLASNGVMSSWQTGSVAGTVSVSARTSTAQGFVIGGEWNGSAYGNIVSYAYLYEIIVYNTVLTTTQIRQVEGYLAQKWKF